MTLLEASLRFPTVVFTVGLVIALLYWLFVMLGALDIDLLGGADADVAGAGKGIGDALAGGAKGGAEALAGGAKGGAEAIKGVSADVDGGFWHALGLTAVPVTVSASVVLLLAWTSSIIGMHYVQPEIGSLGGWFGALVLFLAFLLGVVVGGLVVRPLRPFFKVHEGKRNRDYVGHTCTITTGRVDDNFGQANLEDGGNVLVIPVRCDRADALVRGQRALIIDYDSVRQAYVVEPADPFGSN